MCEQLATDRSCHPQRIETRVTSRFGTLKSERRTFAVSGSPRSVTVDRSDIKVWWLSNSFSPVSQASKTVTQLPV